MFRWDEFAVCTYKHIFSFRHQHQQVFGRQWKGAGKSYQPRSLPLLPNKYAGTKLNSASHTVIQGRSVRYIPKQVFTGTPWELMEEVWCLKTTCYVLQMYLFLISFQYLTYLYHCQQKCHFMLLYFCVMIISFNRNENGSGSNSLKFDFMSEGTSRHCKWSKRALFYSSTPIFCCNCLFLVFLFFPFLQSCN